MGSPNSAPMLIADLKPTVLEIKSVLDARFEVATIK